MLPADELIRIVASDLTFLLEEWDEEVDDDSLRRSSPVLRRLLVDNELQRAWKASGFEREPRVETSTLAPILTRVPKEKIIFAGAGGAKYAGAELRGALIANYAMSGEEVGQHHGDGVPSETMGLRSFIEAPCVVVEGRLVPRRVLIKFVANKLGGAHYDPKRQKTDEETLFRRLDRALREVQLLGKPAVYFELLAMGQALVASPGIGKFMAKVSGKAESV